MPTKKELMDNVEARKKRALKVLGEGPCTLIYLYNRLRSDERTLTRTTVDTLVRKMPEIVQSKVKDTRFLDGRMRGTKIVVLRLK